MPIGGRHESHAATSSVPDRYRESCQTGAPGVDLDIRNPFILIFLKEFSEGPLERNDDEIATLFAQVSDCEPRPSKLS